MTRYPANIDWAAKLESLQLLFHSIRGLRNHPRTQRPAVRRSALLARGRRGHFQPAASIDDVTRHNPLMNAPTMLKTLPLLLAAAMSAPTWAQEPLIDIYKGIHAHPELSHQEKETSAIVAKELRAAGFAVAEHVGVYPDGSKAHGVVGVMKNGPGPTLLVRADMDALPITEETGVSYASHVRATTLAGQDVGVMHACGHDIHATILIGVARAMGASRAGWHGTLMLVGQPSEETVDGARAMLADRLYERFGRPDMIVGLHDGSEQPAGKVSLAIGPAQSGSASVDVTIRGIGGHGAMPQLARDPIVIAAEFITQLQTIVSRETDPQEPAVVTVGSIHGGTRRNIIPDEVKLQLTTRYFSDASRDTILTGIRQRAAGVAIAAGLPPDKAPTVTVLDNESVPVTYNDPGQSRRVEAVLIKTLGKENVEEVPAITPSEDVGVFSLPGHQIPLTYYWLGAANPDAFAQAAAAGKSLPETHNSKFLPDPEPTIATGVRSMTAVATALLQ
jgi:hippurate hydrolase